MINISLCTFHDCFFLGFACAIFLWAFAPALLPENIMVHRKLACEQAPGDDGQRQKTSAKNSAEAVTGAIFRARRELSPITSGCSGNEPDQTRESSGNRA